MGWGQEGHRKAAQWQRRLPGVVAPNLFPGGAARLHLWNSSSQGYGVGDPEEPTHLYLEAAMISVPIFSVVYKESV